MKKPLIPLLGILLAIPVGLALWFGYQSAEEQSARLEKGLIETVQSVLETRSEDLVSILEEWKVSLLELSRQIEETGESPYESFPKLVRSHPWIRQIFVQSENSEILYPDQNFPSSKEQEFFIRMDMILPAFTPGQVQEGQKAEDSGWFFWFWREGQQFLFWTRRADGQIWGYDLERYALLAQMIEPLSRDLPLSFIPALRNVVLKSPEGKVFYQWGGDGKKETDYLLGRFPLPYPFGGWSYEVSIVEQIQLGSGDGWKTGFYWAGFFLTIVFIGLILVILYHLQRDFREASLRQSFVNQVSHELKTPLTNIRLYAELLENRLIGQKEPKSASYLRVILDESLRLSRLIHNVLTFSRKGKLQEIQNQWIIPDDVISDVLRSFQLSLTNKALEVQTRFQVPFALFLDKDKLEQIVGNLISNAEKYAADGRFLHLGTSYDQGRLILEVQDQGPGIPAGMEERIFQPFVRLKTLLSDGAGGTGLGLTISKDLAVLMGGELKILPSPRGARFCLTIPCDKEES